jgi:hypothetical protein
MTAFTSRNLLVQYDETSWPCLLFYEDKSESIIMYLTTVPLVFNTHGAALHRLMHATRKKYFQLVGKSHMHCLQLKSLTKQWLLKTFLRGSNR